MQPDAGLIADANGDLFGTTDVGGANGDGTVFEIAKTAARLRQHPDHAGQLQRHQRCRSGRADRRRRRRPVRHDRIGGANGDGTVFEIKNTGTVSAPVYASAPTTLVSFNGSNGAIPMPG